MQKMETGGEEVAMCVTFYDVPNALRRLYVTAG